MKLDGTKKLKKSFSERPVRYKATAPLFQRKLYSATNNGIKAKKS